MKKIIISVSVVLLLLSACSTHTHIVGDGPSSGVTETARQYYLLYGLVPITKVDTKAMAGDATNYKIETGYQPIDMAIGFVAGMIIPTTVYSRTVKVTK
tara:strand:+ start:193 stop:489 length:297 start_codon:yes stop_codon:yes gene_type:complete